MMSAFLFAFISVMDC